MTRECRFDRRATRMAVALCTFAPALARATDQGTSSPIAESFLPTTVGLAVVLVLIFAVAWVLRRVSPAVGGARGVLRIVAAQSVGQRERVVIVEVGEQWLVLGVAAGHVSALSTMPRGVAPEPPRVTDAFAVRLARALNRRES